MTQLTIPNKIDNAVKFTENGENHDESLVNADDTQCNNIVLASSKIVVQKK